MKIADSLFGSGMLISFPVLLVAATVLSSGVKLPKARSAKSRAWLLSSPGSGPADAITAKWRPREHVIRRS